MPRPPITYRPIDYPPKYRPLGYPPPAPDPVEPASPLSAPPRRRWRWAALVLLLLATVVAHAGIAWADHGDGAKSAPAAAKTAGKQSASGSCDASGDFGDLGGDTGADGSQGTGGGSASDPARAKL